MSVGGATSAAGQRPNPAHDTAHDVGHNPCATCGACCRSYVVPVFGYDVWLISAHQRLSPEQFLIAYPQQEPNVDAFRLDRESQHFGLALDKRGGPFKPERPCVFLVDLAGGQARCGIYAHRPVVCQSYPMAMWSGVVAQRPESLCPPDSWPLAQVVRPSWRAALQRLRRHWDVYGEVVARWNARVAAVPPGAGFVLPEYYSYLINVYDRLAALDGEVGPAGIAEVEASWPNVPRAALGLEDLAHLAARAEERPWLRYLGLARRVIDGFYPEIPPLPPQMRATTSAPAASAPDHPRQMPEVPGSDERARSREVR
ncbi:MAG: YkgJ family cysteine cluster protein [Chloroflexota bacterium]